MLHTCGENLVVAHAAYWGFVFAQKAAFACGSMVLYFFISLVGHFCPAGQK